MDALEALLLRISDPTNPEYGRHMRREAVQEMTANVVGRAALRAHLQSIHGVTIRAETLYGEYLTATAPVRVWEDMLDTTFHVYHHDAAWSTRTGATGATDGSGLSGGGAPSGDTRGTESPRELVRCEGYSLPAELHPHVAHVFGTVQMPLSDGRRPYGTSERVERHAWDQTQPLADAARGWNLAPATADGVTETEVEAEAGAGAGAEAEVDQNHRSLAAYTGFTPTSKNCFMNNTMTPCRVRQVYSITGVGSPAATQGVFSSRNESFSPSDLRTFQLAFNLKSNPIATVVGGHMNGDRVCAGGKIDCGDVMLDAEYLMSTAPRSPTTYWYVDAQKGDKIGPWKTSGGNDIFTAWVIQLNLARTVPYVLTVHFSGSESDVTGSMKDTFTNEMLKLNAIGVTVVVASGDDGAPGPGAVGNSDGCGYNPQFPATNPYVLSVGATQGLEQSYKTERACQSNTRGLITSGGGFSGYYTALAHQKVAVDGYLAKPTAAVTPAPGPGYSATKRAYPDISAAGIPCYSWPCFALLCFALPCLALLLTICTVPRR
jgi:hypothetical protein